MKTIGKMMKWILIGGAALIGVIIVGIILLLLFAGYKNENYWKFADPKGAIEEKYTALGEYEVSSEQFDADDVCKKFSVWYPSELENGNKAYPLVLMVNGTGAKASASSSGFRHLASWGFIVVGNEDENTRTGESTATTLDFMLAQNADPQSIFYGRIDTENIGIAGHSQGGVGAINAVTQQENGTMYKAICTQSTTSSAVAYALNLLDGELGGGWNCDTSTLPIPAFMVAGTGSADAGNVNETDWSLLKAKHRAFVPSGGSRNVSMQWMIPHQR